MVSIYQEVKSEILSFLGWVKVKYYIKREGIG